MKQRMKSRCVVISLILGLGGMVLVSMISPMFEIADPSDVLIVAYMRSGSKFVGKVLGFRDDSFYWYEPFYCTHKWEYLSNEETWCNYGKAGCKNSTQSVNTTLQYVLDIYKCENLDQHFGSASPYQHKATFTGPTGAVYENCLNSSTTFGCITKSKKNTAEYKQCIQPSLKMCFNKAIQTCTTARYRVAKTVRMSTAHAQYLLERHDRLKVVQIFRDPRAVIYSRVMSGWYYKDKSSSRTTDDALVLCKRIGQDISAAEHLKRLYPERVKIIQYEDFGDPMRLAVNLYTFLNMEMTKSAEQLLKTLANVNPKDKKAFHPDSYRYHLNWEMVESINKVCGGVIKRLGLRVFENRQELIDYNLSVVMDTLPYAID